ncbi:MAG: AarF/ABC1/UbiB kinase family protein [Pseudomonadota bacterium]
MLSTIPDLVPPEYAAELSQLQSQAPAMGWPFVKRRMQAELGPGWQARFASFEKEAAAAASLGQVHRATSLDGRALACKLQYPEMQSAVEADLAQFELAVSLYKRVDSAIDPSQMGEEIGARLREELDYDLEARHIALYSGIMADEPRIEVPNVLSELSTNRLLTMTWLEGAPLADWLDSPLEDRNAIARALFNAWWHPLYNFGVIHGDPHMGNYTVRASHDGTASGINLLDFGCIRTFAPAFVGGVIELYLGVLHDDRARIVNAYETWGFKGLSNDLIDILTIWAKFIYAPLLEDRVRKIDENTSPGEYGRKQAFEVHKGLREKGPVQIPREFVFMDRAAIGLGGVFLRLGSELNYYRMFNEVIEGFDEDTLRARQVEAFNVTGVPVPEMPVAA